MDEKKNQDFIGLQSWNQVDVLKELSDKKPNLILNNQVARNIEIIFRYLIHNKEEKIKLKKPDFELDTICQHILEKFMKTDFWNLRKYIEISFIDFEDDDIFQILDARNYQIYCSDNNKKPKWNTRILNDQIKKLESKQEFNKYIEFNLLRDRFKEFPFSHFNFPNEEGKDRFVFYFNIYSNGSKKDIIGLMKDLNLDNRISKFIEFDEINSQISVYALGFSFSNKKLERVTYYSSFSNPFDVTGNKKFLKKKHDLNFRVKIRNIWTYAVDIYEDREEFKLYEESHKFEEELFDKDIESTLKNKISTRVFKLGNNKLKSIKYEFQIKKFFSDYERVILKCNSDILSLYIKDKKIIHRVEYNL